MKPMTLARQRSLGMIAARPELRDGTESPSAARTRNIPDLPEK
jgi:hypothetical protein